MRNLGYGFVQMATREKAEEAKERMQDIEVQGRRIRVGWAQRNTALFIGELNSFFFKNQVCGGRKAFKLHTLILFISAHVQGTWGKIPRYRS